MKENQIEELAVNVKDLETVLIPLTSAQLLTAYYTLLAYARQQGDSRKDDEIFKDCFKDFRKVSQMLEDALAELEPEALYVELRGHIKKS